MAIVINTNIQSLAAQRNLWRNNISTKSSLEKLASGNRINHASDDAAGIQISDNLTAQIKSFQKAVDNAQDGANVLQIGEGALSVIARNLQRIRELAIQGANDTNSTIERRAIAEEITARLTDVDRIASSTKGNNVKILDGSTNSYLLQVGTLSDESLNTLNIGDVFVDSRSSALGITVNSITAIGAGHLENGNNIRSFINQVDNAITVLNSRRSALGSYQNALNSRINNLSITLENLKSTNSRIRDLDIAEESAKLIHSQILQNSNMTILAQSNQLPGQALKLIS